MSLEQPDRIKNFIAELGGSLPEQISEKIKKERDNQFLFKVIKILQAELENLPTGPERKTLGEKIGILQERIRDNKNIARVRKSSTEGGLIEKKTDYNV